MENNMSAPQKKVLGEIRATESAKKPNPHCPDCKGKGKVMLFDGESDCTHTTCLGQEAPKDSGGIPKSSGMFVGAVNTKDLDLDTAKLRKTMDEYLYGESRYLTLSGMSARSLAGIKEAARVGPNDTLILQVHEGYDFDKEEMLKALKSAGIDRERVVVIEGLTATVVEGSTAIQANPQLS